MNINNDIMNTGKERMILVNKQRESEDHIAPPTDTPTTSQYSLQQILQKIDQVYKNIKNFNIKIITG